MNGRVPNADSDEELIEVPVVKLRKEIEPNVAYFNKVCVADLLRNGEMVELLLFCEGPNEWSPNILLSKQAAQQLRDKLVKALGPMSEGDGNR